ncbi:pygopus homolog 1 isoform X1 [Clupea harengus]|uniref:Pygopus homolog 1 isoform X1 n=1 Tax=Clupea harengus TaxID=7950 RepID=A0A6P3VEV6_CLUHA|nr:pygopus homolog 1 isoform X1 [Clupea harengus]
MSTEQDKDTSLKRNRGGDVGLDGLGGPGLLLGSPDKKKRKSSTQVLPFVPLSEYAPPPNPSADHLVASNPFDDGYSVPSYKPLLATNPYFGPSHYPGFCGYSPHRMAPHIQNRMPAPYGGAYPVRNQLHPFAQNQMGMTFNRAPGFNYGHPENPNYGNQSMFSNNSNMPLPAGQPFRPGPGENFNQMLLHNVNQNAPPDTGPSFGPEGNNSGNPTGKACTNISPSFTPQQQQQRQQQQQQQQQPQQSNFLQSTSPRSKQDAVDSSGKSTSQTTSPHKPRKSSEENVCQDNTSDLKSKTRGAPISQDGVHPNSSEKINGIIHPTNNAVKKSPPSCVPMDTPSMEERHKRSSGGVGMVGANKLRAHPSRPSLSSAEPVYPCGICLNEVNDDQEAILCDASCQKWFHRVCTGMTETAYNLLAAEAAAVWGCDTCMEEKGAQLVRLRETSGPPTVNSEG